MHLDSEISVLDKKRQFVEKSVFFTSLGCSKNLVDSQVMLGYMGLDGFSLAQDPSLAEVIVINTCSFIDAAKQESIEVILEMADYKNPENGACKALVVSGCMAQRYSLDLEKEMPEVDLFIGTGEYNKIVLLLKAFEENQLTKKSFVEIPKYIHSEVDPRLNTSPFYTAWLKVSEGCNRNCTFCIIPTLRGKLRSRSVESLIKESNQLTENGVRELNIISQDLSDYGVDLDHNNDLLQLLKGMETVEAVDWVRLFYFYPDQLTEEIMDCLAASKKICSYLDTPIQHFSDSVLKRMNRKITGSEITRRMLLLKKKIPDMILRTSVIVGFPGETEEDFQKLLDGVESIRFNHLGIFRYSDEEGTPAYNLQPKVPADVIDQRFDRLHELQRGISKELNQALVGKTLSVLVEGPHEETELLWSGRHAGQAPEIDGQVIINDFSDQKIKTGDLVNVEITGLLDYDLIGKVIPSFH
ncbi:MAG: 30S ribosomal protein S12 methylthiotransferase RimO [Halobacteriovoraceae bacterium]|jgi:ribosomal protein S12 methylthiotransferase|nr:30S ribosomal protein S12 methylthiotransferase RimO [Halobacteriovoraceae bacterium]MBT5095902.1 30S ribosomal protein S12 methylthiotransferase RimO [Halobacteriovoraceae bacterium]